MNIRENLAARAAAVKAGMVITLPNGRPIGLGRYANAWRELLKMDPRRAVAGFDFFPAPAGEILAKMRAGLMDRINRHDRRYGIGRKWCSDWERGMRSAAWMLNSPRLIIDWLPPELKPRFSYRLRSAM